MTRQRLALLLAIFRRTRREYLADFFITPPLTLIALAVSLATSGSVAWPAWLALGLIGWTFYEYAAHRWILHGLWLARDAHALHHRDPLDYISLHPAATVVLYLLFWAAFGFGSSAAMVGFSTGYVIYSAAHTAFHYAQFREGGWLAAAQARHAVHHRFARSNFGVTLPVWDMLFRTYRSPA